MPNALQVLNPPNQNQLYLILNNAGYNQPDQSGTLPGFFPGELETNALRAMDLGGNK